MSFPLSSNVGVLPRALAVLDTNVKQVNAAPVTEPARKAQLVAQLVGSIVVIIFAAIDQVKDIALAALKAVPVLLNVTLGRVFGLSKYIAQPHLTGQDFLGHLKNVRNCFVIQVNAAMVFFFLQQPAMVLSVAREMKVFPVPVTTGGSSAANVPLVPGTCGQDSDCVNPPVTQPGHQSAAAANTAAAGAVVANTATGTAADAVVDATAGAAP